MGKNFSKANIWRIWSDIWTAVVVHPDWKSEGRTSYRWKYKRRKSSARTKGGIMYALLRILMSSSRLGYSEYWSWMMRFCDSNKSANRERDGENGSVTELKQTCIKFMSQARRSMRFWVYLGRKITIMDQIVTPYSVAFFFLTILLHLSQMFVE